MALPILEFSDFKEGGCIGKPQARQYFITENHDGKFVCHWDHCFFDTLEEAQAEAQRHYRQIQSLAPVVVEMLPEPVTSVQDFMDIMTMRAASSLDVDTTIENK